jgi:hypothetical protein
MNSLCKATLLLTIAALGCAPRATTVPGEGGPAAEGEASRRPAAPVQLAYAPQATPLTYVSLDSGAIRMEIPGMGPMDVGFGLSATSQLALASAADGLEATVTITSLSGHMQNPQTGTTAADNTVIPRDPGRLTIKTTGEITSARLPELSRTLREVTTPSALYRGLFVRLPRNQVAPGATWMDTVEIVDQLGTLSTKQRHEYQWTYVGDTVIGGRRLVRLEAAVATTTTVAGDAGGMQIEQRLAGPGTQSVLWDPARGAMIERRFDNSSTGTMTVVGAGIGDIPVTQRVRSVARLKEGG